MIALLIHFHFFGEKNGDELLAHDDVRTSNRNICITSLMLTIAAVISTITGQVDSLMIPHFLSNRDLVSFSITFRVITYEMLVYHILFAAIMPSIGKWFFSQNEWGSICATHKSVFRCSLSIGLGVGYFNVTYLRDILHLWIGDRITIGQNSIFVLSLYFVVFGLHSANYAVYSCFNVKRKTQIAVSFIEPLLKIVISYFLIKEFGVAGATYSILLLAALVTFPLTTVMLYFLSDKRVMLWKNFSISSLVGLFLAVALLGVISDSTSLLKHVAGTMLVIVFLLNAVYVIKCGLGSHVRVKGVE
jgi:O-antigen/teichoic acid export membrane protein